MTDHAGSRAETDAILADPQTLAAISEGMVGGPVKEVRYTIVAYIPVTATPEGTATRINLHLNGLPWVAVATPQE